MAGCTNGITKAIVSDCSTQPVGGLERVAYIMNRADVVITKTDNLISNIAMVTGKLAYKFTGVNKNINAGSDRVKADDMADTFTHYASIKAFERDAEAMLNLDGLGDVIVIVENKQKYDDGDGIFEAFGVNSGLHVSTDTKRANDAHGVRSIELTSKAQEEEPFSTFIVLDTDYETTKELLEGLTEVIVIP